VRRPSLPSCERASIPSPGSAGSARAEALQLTELRARSVVRRAIGVGLSSRRWDVPERRRSRKRTLFENRPNTDRPPRRRESGGKPRHQCLTRSFSASPSHCSGNAQPNVRPVHVAGPLAFASESGSGRGGPNTRMIMPASTAGEIRAQTSVVLAEPSSEARDTSTPAAGTTAKSRPSQIRNSSCRLPSAGPWRSGGSTAQRRGPSTNRSRPRPSPSGTSVGLAPNNLRIPWTRTSSRRRGGSGGC
jgi:hypothetical protein